MKDPSRPRFLDVITPDMRATSAWDESRSVNPWWNTYMEQSAYRFTELVGHIDRWGERAATDPWDAFDRLLRRTLLSAQIIADDPRPKFDPDARFVVENIFLDEAEGYLATIDEIAESWSQYSLEHLPKAWLLWNMWNDAPVSVRERWLGREDRWTFKPASWDAYLVRLIAATGLWNFEQALRAKGAGDFEAFSVHLAGAGSVAECFGFCHGRAFKASHYVYDRAKGGRGRARSTDGAKRRTVELWPDIQREGWTARKLLGRLADEGCDVSPSAAAGWLKTLRSGAQLID